MSYIYDEATNTQINVEDIRGFTVTNEEGNTVYAADLGDTRKSRNQLAIASTPLSTTWDYMPKTSQDIAQSIALDTMVDGGALQMAKILGGTIGAIFGAGAGAPTVGAGIGYMMVEAGIDAYNWIDKAGQNPNQFWNEFVSNAKERSEDGEFQKFLGGVGLGSSFTASGASTGLFKDWADVIGEKGFSTGVGEVVGMLTRSAATVLAGGEFATAAIVADVSLSSASREASTLIGLGEEVPKALGAGVLHGVASGVTGGLFVGALPYLMKTHAPALVMAANNNAVASVAATGAEFAAWGTVEQNLINFAEGKDFELDPFVFGTSFALGAGFGLLTRGVSSPSKIKSEAIDIARPEPKGFVASLEKHYTHEELSKMGYRMLKSDKATGLSGLVYENPVSLSARIRKEHYDIKNYGISMESAEIMAKNYGVASPYAGRTWSMAGSAITARTGADFGNIGRNISKGAGNEVESRIKALIDMGVLNTPESVKAFNDQLIQTALADNKGSIGNFEIRKAFEKIMTGGAQ